MGPLTKHKLLILVCLTIVQAHSADWSSEYNLASAAYDTGDYATAEQHYKTALALAESFGESDLRLEATLSRLGAMSQLRGKEGDAELLLRRSLAIRQARFGKDSLETAQGQNNLAAVWQQTGRTQEAAKLQAEAWATAERILQPNDAKMVPFLTLAALIAKDASQYPKAEELLKRARTLAESEAAENAHPLMQVFRYLGFVYLAAGHFDEAEQCFKSLIALSESRFGHDRVDTANGLGALAGVLCQRKFFADARPYLLEAVDIFGKLHETNLESYAGALENLASVELYLGQAREAEQHSLAAIKVLKNQPNVDSEALAVADNNLGQVYALQGRYKEAEASTIQAKAIWIAKDGAESARVAAAVSNLGALCVQQHKYKKAEVFYNQALEIDNKVSGPASADYARELNRLAVAYNYQKHYLKSEEILRQALEIASARLGARSPALADSYINLAVSLQGQRRLDEALECYQHGIEIMVNAGQKDARIMALVLDQYSTLLRALKRYADAEKASTEALGIIVKEKTHGETYR
jgi:tetratricopeptide (TPR) repeat protein